MQNLRRNIKLDYIYNLLDRLNMQSVIWVLYLAYKGMSLTEIGLIEGVYHLTSILCEVPSGAAADLLGRKRTVVAGRILVLISCFLTLMGNSFFTFCLAFMVQALGNNLNSGSEEALIYDSMKAMGDEEGYIKVGSNLNTIIEVSSAVATVMGGIISHYSYTACYLISCGFAASAILPVLLMTEPPIEKQTEKQRVLQLIKNHFSRCFGILGSSRKLTATILFFNVIIVLNSVMSFYSQQYFSATGHTNIEIGAIMLVVGLFAGLGALLSDKIYALMGRRFSVLAAALVTASAASFFTGSTTVVCACLCVCSFITAALWPIKSTKINALIPSAQRATLISVDSLVYSLGMIAIFPAVGFVADLITK